MNIMTRFVRLFKADVHGVMDQLEDKRLLLRQYLREMETSLGQKKARAEALSAHMDRLSAQLARHRSEMGKLDHDVDLALGKEKDDIARKLIRRRLDFAAAVARLDEQLSGLTQEKGRLTETIAEQQLQYDTFKARADAWQMRCEDDPFAGAARSFPDDGGPAPILEEEIELELIRRKAALVKGGAA